MIASITHNWHNFAIFHIPSGMGGDPGEGWNGGVVSLVPHLGESGSIAMNKLSTAVDLNTKAVERMVNLLDASKV